MTTRPCAAGRTCPSLRQTWRDGDLARLRCDVCGFTCSVPAKVDRGTVVVLQTPAPRVERRVVAVA